MMHSSSVGRTTLAFSAGSVGLASAFVMAIAVAVVRANTSHAAPIGTDYQWAAAALLLLIAGFFGVLVAARRAALSIPSARTGFFTGLAGVTLLLVTMFLVGKPLGMRGPMIIALVAGIVSGAGALRLAKSGPGEPAEV